MRLFHKYDSDLEFGARCFFLLILLLIVIGVYSDEHQIRLERIRTCNQLSQK